MNQRVKDHFEAEAQEYDGIILRLIPNYREMLDVLVSTLPFFTNQPFTVIDLGCGTGTVSRKIKDAFPNACLTCVDIAKNMLDIAWAKTGPGTTLIHADFHTFDFPQKYEAVVSSLALHHLEKDEEKQALYDKIFRALNAGGVFINIDVVTSGVANMQQVYLEKWKEYMVKNVHIEEIENKWLPNYYAEDRPIPLLRHFEMLKHSGFQEMDVAYKYYNYAVYFAKK